MTIHVELSSAFAPTTSAKKHVLDDGNLLCALGSLQSRLLPTAIFQNYVGKTGNRFTSQGKFNSGFSVCIDGFLHIAQMRTSIVQQCCCFLERILKRPSHNTHFCDWTAVKTTLGANSAAHMQIEKTLRLLISALHHTHRVAKVPPPKKIAEIDGLEKAHSADAKMKCLRPLGILTSRCASEMQCPRNRILSVLFKFTFPSCNNVCVF